MFLKFISKKGSSVSTLHENLSVPVTCKMRVFADLERTIKYAQMLEKAGAQILTVHGRTREQKGPLTGMADWSYIKAVRENINVPIFANGNILSMEDVDRCLEATGCQGVMTAEGNLHNPAFFDRIIPLTWDMAKEYLDLVEQYPCPTSYIRGHLFKMFHHLLNLNRNAIYREALATSQKVSDFRKVVLELETEFSPYHNAEKLFVNDPPPPNANEENVPPEPVTYNLSLPPWLCQPYIRMEPEEHKKLMAEKVKIAEDPTRKKRNFFDDEGNLISRKLAKKLKRIERRPNYAPGMLNQERVLELCSNEQECVNPVGIKCGFQMCKTCCRDLCYTKDLECVGHKFLLEKRQRRAQKQKFEATNDISQAQIVINDEEVKTVK